MDRLRNEIVSMIFDHISRDDIINLPHALSCKGLTTNHLTRLRNYDDIWIDEGCLRFLLRGRISYDHMYASTANAD